MCRPSATSAIDPKRTPPTISPIIIALQSTITAQARRSFARWLEARKTCVCAPGAPVVRGSAIGRLLFQIGSHHRQQVLGRLGVEGVGVLLPIDQVRVHMVLD